MGSPCSTDYPWRFLRLDTVLTPDAANGGLKEKTIGVLTRYDIEVMIDVFPRAQLSLFPNPARDFVRWKTNRHGGRFYKTLFAEVAYLNEQHRRALQGAAK